MSNDQRPLSDGDHHHHGDHDEVEPDETTSLIDRRRSTSGSTSDSKIADLSSASMAVSHAAVGSGVSGGGILKSSQSSSTLAGETTSGTRRPSAMHRSMSQNFKRVSIAGDPTRRHEPLVGVIGGQDNVAADVEDGSMPPVMFRAGVHRPTVRRTTSYGTIYPPIYQKLSTLHRLSFADVVERITLTWENINVYAPAGSSGPSGGESSGVSAVKRGLSASNSKVPELQQKHILKDGRK